MNDFDALLKRSFAEAPEPGDDGFSAAVTRSVARRETFAKLRTMVHGLALTAAAGAIVYGGWNAALSIGPEWMASLGLEVARAHGALSQTPDLASSASSLSGTLLRSLSAGLTQILLVGAALAGGATVYCASQE